LYSINYGIWFFQGAKGVKGFMGEEGPFGDKVRSSTGRISRLDTAAVFSWY
jgi:hypothetical protein